MNRETLKNIYKKFNLVESDIFMLKFGNTEKPIITRQGCEKIQKQLGIEIKFEIQSISDDHKYVVVLGTGVSFTMNEKQQKVPHNMCQSFGEASPQNNKSPYPIAMAEKRSLARIIIKMSQLGEYGVYGEDESPDFIKQ